MKTNKFLAFAVLMSGMAFTACTTSDNPIGVGGSITTSTISFEGKTLGDDGYWMGDESGTEFDNWGSPAYKCNYSEAGVNFEVNYTPAWGSFSGFALSSRTESTFNSETMVPDEFNCIAGGARSGKNFCVVYTFGETINFPQATTLKGFFYTNSAWTVDAILNGDGMTPGKFEESDYLKCTITGTKADNTTASVDIWLAKDGNYVKGWQYANLRSMGKIKSISFSFDGSKKNDYGLTTPTYICIDDIEIEY